MARFYHAGLRLLFAAAIARDELRTSSHEGRERAVSAASATSPRAENVTAYNVQMACPVCEKRKAKRFCPAKSANICARCCGQNREVTIDCPFECPYLQESRESDYKHQGGLDPKDFPYKEIHIEEGFVRDHAGLLTTCGRELLIGAQATAGSVDEDARQALDSLTRSYKTRESGLYYDSKPDSPFGRRIFDHAEEAVARFREEETRSVGFARTRDADVMKVWVFLYRMALDRDNGRSRGKAFLDFLRLHFQRQAEEEPSLIIPGA